MFPASVSLSFTRLHCANTAKLIEVLFGMETLGTQGTHVLKGNLDFPHGFDGVFTKLLWPLARLVVCLCARA